MRLRSSKLSGRMALCCGAILLFLVPLLRGQEAIIQALRAHQYQSALTACDRELKTQPANPRLWMLRGVALQSLGKLQDALASFRRAARVAPGYVPALEAQAQLEYQTKDPACGRTLAKIVSLGPENPAAHGMLGVLAYEKRDCKTAVRHFEKAGPAMEANGAALWQFGNCLYQLRRPEDAAARFQALLSQRESAPVRYNLGLALLDAKQPGAAVEVLKPLARGERPDGDSLNLLAAAQQAAKQTPEALQTLRRATELYPQAERNYIDFASICMENSSLEVGTEVLEVGTKNLPGSARLRASLGVLLVRAGRMAEAEREFQRAQELDPEAAYGTVGLSLALLQADHVEESIAMLRAQKQRNPGSAMVVFMLAQALLRNGPEPGQPAFEESQQLLRRAVELDPNHSRAHGLLGKNYVLKGDLPGAIRELETALRLNPADRTSAYQLVLVYGRTGQKELAAKWQARVRELMQADRDSEAGSDKVRILKAAPQREGS